MSELIMSWIQSLLVAHSVKQVGKLRPPRHAGHEQLIARKAHLAVKKRRRKIYLQFFFSFLTQNPRVESVKREEEEEYHSPEAKKYLFIFSWLLDVD